MEFALLFDLDGTMLHSDPIHVAVFAELMGPHGISVDEAFYMSHVHGRMNVDFFAEFLPDLEDPEALSQTKEALFRERLPKPYPEMAGLGLLLDRAEAQGWAKAVVTNAMPANASAMLQAIGHRARFDVVISAEECARGKPDPLPYQVAMEALGVTPERAIAFEDSPSGLRAARAAGIFAVGIRSSLDDAALRDAGAHMSLQDFNDPALEEVLRRAKGVQK